MKHPSDITRPGFEPRWYRSVAHFHSVHYLMRLPALGMFTCCILGSGEGFSISLVRSSSSSPRATPRLLELDTAGLRPLKNNKINNNNNLTVSKCGSMCVCVCAHTCISTTTTRFNKIGQNLTRNTNYNCSKADKPKIITFLYIL